MSTTTIRVDADTHARLLELSRTRGTSLIETVRDAAEALRRQSFGHQVTAELAALRTDAAVWDAYLAEADSTSSADGVS